MRSAVAISASLPLLLVAAAPAAAADVTSFTLIDADADVPIPGHDPLLDSAVLDLTALPTRNLNVRADLSGAAGSVVFDLDGVSDYRTENVGPYALEGDNAGDYNPWTPAVGVHDLTASPYNGADGTGGLSGAVLTIRFTVIDPVGNLPPAADAGPDQFLLLPTSSTVLNGTATDLDGTIDTWAWTQEAGPPATLDGVDTPDLLVDGLVRGSYLFRLTVTDDDGDTGSDDAAVVVSDGSGFVSGELKLWHTVTITFDGPPVGEGADPNPFRDYRLQVRFDHPQSGAS